MENREGRIRVYYAHAKCTYGTELEREEITVIRRNLPNCELVDPREHEGNLEKQLKGMKYCFELIDSCEALVFSKLLDKITAGVGAEANHALSRGIPVYQLSHDGLKRIKKPVKYLSIEETISYYECWWQVTARARIVASK